VAALVGAVTGGIVALLGSIAQVVTQGWMTERGEITCNVAAWGLVFSYAVGAFNRSDPNEDPGYHTLSGFPLEVARTYKAEPSSEVSLALAKVDGGWHSSYFEGSPSFRSHVQSGDFDFALNFLNTKGTNAAVLEYSVQFLKGKQTLITKLPEGCGEGRAIYRGQAMALPAENVAAFLMRGSLDEEESAKILLGEVDSVVFTARLSTGRNITVELARLSQDSKGVAKGDTT
jgi:hypothetical protein